MNKFIVYELRMFKLYEEIITFFFADYNFFCANYAQIIKKFYNTQKIKIKNSTQKKSRTQIINNLFCC